MGCGTGKIRPTATIAEFWLSFSCNIEVFLIKYSHNIRKLSFGSFVELTLARKESSFLECQRH